MTHNFTYTKDYKDGFKAAYILGATVALNQIHQWQQEETPMPAPPIEYLTADSLSELEKRVKALEVAVERIVSDHSSFSFRIGREIGSLYKIMDERFAQLGMNQPYEKP